MTLSFDDFNTRLISIERHAKEIISFLENASNAKTNSKSDFLNSEAIAERYNLPLATIRKWNFEKRYPTAKAGRHVLIKVCDFENYLQSKTRKGC